LFGGDDFRKEEVLRDVVDAALDAHTRDFNLDVIRGGDVSAEQLGSLLQTPPMMARRRVVVIKDVLALRQDARAMVDQYLVSPSPDTVVIATIPAGSKPDRELEEACTAIEVSSLGTTELAEWIAHRVRELGGEGIAPEASALLQSGVGADSGALANELDKLVSYTSSGRIDMDAVRAVVGVREGQTISDFLDCVAVRDVLGALRLVDVILAQPKTTLVSVVMALSAQTLALSWGRHAREAGLPTHQLEREFYTLLKETGAFPMRPWGDAVKCWSRSLKYWDAAALRRAMHALRAADQGAKDTRVSNDEQILATLVCTMCAPVARQAA
jgi:DNA polymerase-3 subunit delta